MYIKITYIKMINRYHISNVELYFIIIYINISISTFNKKKNDILLL